MIKLINITMNHRVPHRRNHVLSRVSSYGRFTVPLATILLMVQAFGVLYSRVEAATQSYESAFATSDSSTPLPPVEFSNPAESHADASMAQVGGNLVDETRRAEIMAQARAEMYHFSSGQGGQAGTVTATNPDRGFDFAYSGAGGMEVTPKRAAPGLLDAVPAEPAWQIRFTARSLEFDSMAIPLDDAVSPPSAGEERATAELAPGCREWYVNRAGGIEHGFTIEDPGPLGHAAGQMTIALEAETDLVPVLDNGEVHFQYPGGRSQLIYRDLHVFDHTGRELPSSMSLETSPTNEHATIKLTTDVQGAVFPLTVDPLILDQEDMSMPDDVLPGHEYGFASAGIPEYLVTTAPGFGSGKAYVFCRDLGGPGNWGQQTTLEVPALHSPAVTDRFGESVAIGVIPETGEKYIAVGAPEYSGCGAVFIFLLVDNTWTFVQRIFPNDLTGGDKFGCSLSISDAFLAIGAYGHLLTGAVIIFSLIAAVWTFYQKIIPAGAVAGDEVGRSVAITARNVLFGATGTAARKGIAYLYTRALVVGALFLFTLILTNPALTAGAEFGWAVVLTLTMLAVSAPRADGSTGSVTDGGAIFIWRFIAATATWVYLQALFGLIAGGLLGYALAMNAFNDIVAGRPGSVAGAVGGAVLVFLFNAVAFNWFAPVVRIGDGHNDPDMNLGQSLVLIGTILFVMAVAYFLGQGAMYRFLLTAVALTFTAWQLIFFTQPMIDNLALQHLVGLLGDYDGDGIPNVVEWAMNLIPTIFDANPLHSFVASNGYFHLVMPISLVALNMLYLIQYAVGLGTWHTMPYGPLAGLFFLNYAELGISSNLLVVSIAITAAAAILFRVRAEEL
jgi:hypothetical protein